VVGNNLSKLLLNIGSIGGLSTDSGTRSAGVVESSTFDVPSRGFGEEEETGTKDKTGLLATFEAKRRA
jgi:hypothetical protein